MSFVVTVPELLEAASGRLQVIGTAVSAANVTAAFPTTGVIPAAADEVSAATAAAFSGYGRLYQAISAEAALIHDEFVKALGLGANSYATTEAENAAQAGGVRVAHVAPPRMAPTAPAARPSAPARMAPAAPPSRAPYGGGYGAAPATMHGGGYAGGNYGGGRVDPYARFSYGGHTTSYGGGYGAHAAAAAPAHPAPAQPAPAHPAPPPPAPAHPAPTRQAPTAPASPVSPATEPAMPAQPVTLQPAPNYPGTAQTEHYVPAYPSPAGPTQALPARA